MESRACASATGVHAVMICSISARTCSSPMLLDAADISVSGGGSSGSLSSGSVLLHQCGGLGVSMSPRLSVLVDRHNRAIISDINAVHARSASRAGEIGRAHV